MLVSPSKAAGPWKEKTEMEISGATFSLIQVTIQLWRQLRHCPEVQYNAAYALTPFPENLPQLINSQLLTTLRGTEPPFARVLDTPMQRFTTWCLFICGSYSPKANSYLKASISRDFSGGPVAKTPSSQCRGPGFDSWSEN